MFPLLLSIRAKRTYVWTMDKPIAELTVYELASLVMASTFFALILYTMAFWAIYHASKKEARGEDEGSIKYIALFVLIFIGFTAQASQFF